MTLAQQIAHAERTYDRALHHPRGNGLAEAGAELARLYARQRTERARQQEAGTPAPTGRAWVRGHDAAPSKEGHPA